MLYHILVQFKLDFGFHYHSFQVFQFIYFGFMVVIQMIFFIGEIKLKLSAVIAFMISFE